MGGGPRIFTLSTTGTINNSGTIRNTFESTPNAIALDWTSCPARVCEVQIIWSIANYLLGGSVG